MMLQFRIELLGVDPPVWRRLLIPHNYTLWDLHVAIQDSMGWLDCHLHAFRIVGSPVTYGIPDEDGDDPVDTRPGWEALVRDVFTFVDPIGLYEYDFGDSWQHLVVFEDFVSGGKAVTRPKCIGGARRCPPEDCGGTHGYAEFLATLADPGHDERVSLLEWVGGRFDAEEFDAAAVKFDHPGKRWKQAFMDDEG